MSAIYDGSSYAASTTTTPEGVAVAVTYNGSPSTPTGAGSYEVVTVSADPNYTGSANGTLVIAKATPVITWSASDAITYGMALSGTQLAASADVAGSFAYDPSAGAVLDTGEHSLDVTFTPTDSANYNSTTAEQTLQVNPTPVTIELSGLSATYDGTTHAVDFGTSPEGVSVAVTYDGSTTAPINAGLYAVVVASDDPNYMGSATGTLVIAKAMPVIAWTELTAITYGTALDTSILSATADIAGAFTYDPEAWSVLGAGEHTLTATFNPTDATNYRSVSVDRTLSVNPIVVTITLNDLDVIYDGQAHAVGVSTAPENVPVVETYDGADTVPSEPGTYAVRAVVADAANYVGETTGTLVIAKATPVVTWEPSGNLVDGDPLSATQLNAVADVSGQLEYDPASDAVLAVGEHKLRVNFTPDDLDRYLVTSATATITVAPRAPSITSQPQSKVVLAGSPVDFTVVADGTPALSYTWFGDGNALVWADAAVFTLPEASVDSPRTFTVQVSNDEGAVTSSLATLTVVAATADHYVEGRGYRAGEPVTITLLLTYNDVVDGLRVSVLPPEESGDASWRFVSSTATRVTTEPEVGAVDLWEWAWNEEPASPLSFSYTIAASETAAGSRNLSAMVALQVAGHEFEVLFNPEPLTLEEAPLFHSADTDGDRRLNLSELLRVIELYNTRQGTTRTGRYKVSESSADGFTPDSDGIGTSTLDRHHSADSSRDGQLSLSELLRVIGLYNTRSGTTRTGAYHSANGTADGFAAGEGE